MDSPHTFHFFSNRSAIRFHISRLLLSKGWESLLSADKALFADKNLILNDEASKWLEYKHLLAALTAKYCPEIMPLTYCINDNNYNSVLAKIIYENYMIDNQYVKDISRLKWILKPSLLNNGDNIILFNNVEALKKHYENPHRLGGEHVIQSYITNPALLEGRKFTLRLPVIFTNFSGVYLCKQGYINISAFPFTLDNFKNRKIHITNYVLDGELSYIEQRSTTTLDNFDNIYSQMVYIVKTVIRALLKVAPEYLKPQSLKIFEIFGFDFMLDNQGKVWLLEINQGPDAPTFEENHLNETLWEPFWENLVQDFVYPIALNISAQKNYQDFTQALSAKQCYSRWDNVLRKVGASLLSKPAIKN